MAEKRNLFIGIDLGGKNKKTTGVCVLEEKKGKNKGFTPLESPAPWGGDEYSPLPFSESAVGFKAPRFLTGFTE